jgi:hypothetical protein
MSVSPVNTASPPPVKTSTPPAATPPAVTSTAQAADGDYKARSSRTSQTKDADGDYTKLPASPAGNSSSNVQAALSNLKLGG